MLVEEVTDDSWRVCHEGSILEEIGTEGVGDSHGAFA